MSYRFQKLDICLTVGCATVAHATALQQWARRAVVVPATRLRPGFAMASRQTGHDGMSRSQLK
jgi:hypothetical protein